MTERAVGYVRVSSDQQVEGYSLDAQRREITSYVEAKGWELVEICEDAGLSAHTDNLTKRIGLERALGMVEPGTILVVHELSRLARHGGVQRQILERIGKVGGGFDTVVGDYEWTTPTGKLVLSVMGAVNELFSDQLGEQTKKGQRERARQGLHTGSLPFAYEEG